MSAQPTSVAPWSLARLVGFRFLFAYVFLYSFPTPFDAIPFTDAVFSKIDPVVWYRLVPFMSVHVFRLHLDLSAKPAGSGDTTYNYVQILCFLALGAAIAAVWSVLDRKRTNHRKLAGMLRVYVRYVLAAALLSYGSVKILKVQFGTPDTTSLMKPLGEMSPMGLLWTFMGTSTPYTFFGGMAEIVPGLFILFRRTTTLGALLAIAVLSNVVMLNFAYDVPVKLYSVHLLLFAIYLAAPDVRRLVDFFILQRPTQPATVARLGRSPRAVVAWRALKVLAIGLLVYGDGKMAYTGWTTWGDGKKAVPGEGVFVVESFARDGEVVPPLLTDTTRWQHVYVDGERFGVRGMDWKWRWFDLKDDAAAHTFALKPSKGTEGEGCTLTYSRPDDHGLALEGTLDGKRVVVRAVKKEASSFPLLSRGFHWVNETPYNR